MSLTDEQVLRWFGPPVAALKNRSVPSDLPKALHADWRLLKSHGFSDEEAHEAMKPSVRRYWSTTPTAQVRRD